MNGNLKRILSFAIAGLLIGCSSSEEKHVGEPNNSILKAGMLEPGKPYTMKIDSVGDIDWYAVPVEGPGYVQISTKTVPDNLTLNVRFAQKQEWKPEKQKWLTNWSKIPKSIPVEKADTIYFVVIDDYSNESSEKPIEFKVDFIAEFDQLEPNNTPRNAHLISSGEIMKTAFFPKTDQDWFKIKVENPGYLMIQARNVPENIEINARYAEKAFGNEGVDFIKNWQKLPAGVQITEPSLYYFVLLDDYNNKMSRDTAEWKIDFMAEMDPTKPNNGFEEAYPVAVGDTLRPTIFPVNDTDYFAISPDSTIVVRLHSQNPENINAQVRLYVKNGFETTPIENWKNMPVQYELKGGKQYYFQLIDDYNNEFSVEPIQLRITAEADTIVGKIALKKPL